MQTRYFSQIKKIWYHDNTFYLLDKTNILKGPTEFDETGDLFNLIASSLTLNLSSLSALFKQAIVPSVFRKPDEVNSSVMSTAADID